MRDSIGYALAGALALMLFVAFMNYSRTIGEEMQERAAHLAFQGYCKSDGALCVHRPADCAAEFISECEP